MTAKILPIGEWSAKQEHDAAMRAMNTDQNCLRCPRTAIHHRCRKRRQPLACHPGAHDSANPGSTDGAVERTHPATM